MLHHCGRGGGAGWSSSLMSGGNFCGSTIRRAVHSQKSASPCIQYVGYCIQESPSGLPGKTARTHFAKAWEYMGHQNHLKCRVMCKNASGWHCCKHIPTTYLHLHSSTHSFISLHLLNYSSYSDQMCMVLKCVGVLAGFLVSVCSVSQQDQLCFWHK